MTDKPVVFLPEDIQRIMGKDAQRNNVLAARMVAEMVKTTLGPKGMDKMLVSPTNDITVTNDGGHCENTGHGSRGWNNYCCDDCRKTFGERRKAS